MLSTLRDDKSIFRFILSTDNEIVSYRDAQQMATKRHPITRGFRDRRERVSISSNARNNKN